MNLKFQAFLDGMRGRRVAVAGVGVSNTPLIKLLTASGARVTAYDRKGEAAPLFPDVPFVTGDDCLDKIDAEYIFRSPGVKPFAPGILEAVERGAVLTSEIEAFMRVCPCPIYAVTGSDGKTTTTTILKLLLETTGKHVYTGGNIGTPLLDKAGDMRPDDIAVLELSSFQLMTMELSPHVAVITNLSPNHLDWHRSMDEYVQSKCNIFLNQVPGDRLVFNRDNQTLAGLASLHGLNPVWFSRKSALTGGVWLDGQTVLRDGEPVLDTTELRIPGVHNIENYMAAIAAAGTQISAESIRGTARSFGGVEHRCEVVAEINGVRYVNDSIASSPTRTVAGLQVFGTGKRVVLIAGGRPKVPFDPLADAVGDYVKTILLVGEAAQQIRKTCGGSVELADCGTVDNAVRRAYEIAVPGDVVMLSPACTSYDQFKNFEERGKLFKKTVEELKEESHPYVV